MKYVDEYRNSTIARKLIRRIKILAKNFRKEVSFMEVCGTHTVAMFRCGIRKTLPANIKVISGPGCPVCVTDQQDIDKAIALSEIDDIIITTFGDMIKVPGTKASLGEMKAKGKDIRIVYSGLDALDIARKNPQKKIVFLAIGFETTAPTIAASVKRAKNEKIRNFFILPAHKLIPPALEALVKSPKCKINGLLLPGHVSTIIGAMSYQFLPEEHGIACVIAGFEALDILESVMLLLEQIYNHKPKVEIQYSRCVKREGNVVAKKALDEVFKVSDAWWRGLGIIRKSGLSLRREFISFDIQRQYHLKIPQPKKNLCRCGDVLQGIISPPECSLFGKSCTPLMPLGPCMVSTEGTCGAYYRYGGRGG